MKGYDDLPLNSDILLDLPFYEGINTITHDVAKPHHILTQHVPGAGAFNWGSLGTGCPYLEFAPSGVGVTAGVYLDCPAADTADLDFTAGDYSIGGWIDWGAGTNQSEILIGRYATQVDGWDIYLNAVSNTLSHRHHHSSLGAGNLKSECFSTGWTPGGWVFFGVSRSGLYPVHYRNGVPLTMNYGGATMLDPDTANRDLVLGCRDTKDANWYYDKMWRPRIWDIELSEADWMQIFETERHWFGV